MSEKGGPGSGLGGGGQMQQELVLDRQDEYIQSRSSAIEGDRKHYCGVGADFPAIGWNGSATGRDGAEDRR
jgi:hypothetical protein